MESPQIAQLLNNTFSPDGNVVRAATDDLDCLSELPNFPFSLLSIATDSKTSKEEKREELFESLKADESIGWAVDVIDLRELSAKMLKKNKINLNEISHESAMGLVRTALNSGVLLTEVDQVFDIRLLAKSAMDILF